MTELEAGLDAGIDGPFMLLQALHVHPGNWPAVPHKRLAAADTRSPSGRSSLQITRFLVDQVLTTAVHSPSAPFARIDEINGFVA